jgi:hypothetical protein
MKRRLKDPPQKLSRLIDLVNGLPAQAQTVDELPSVSVGLALANLQAKSDPRLQLEALRRKLGRPYNPSQIEQSALTTLLEQLPRHVREFIEASDDSESPAPDYVLRNRYDELAIGQRLLQQIAGINNIFLSAAQEHDRSINEEDMRELWSATEFEWPIDFRGWVATLEVTKEGKFEWKPGFLIEAVLNPHTELSRIRTCAICGSLFWAGRIDALCCRPEHAHILRTRRWNEKYQEKYKQQRIRKAQQEEARSSAARRRQTKSKK